PSSTTPAPTSLPPLSLHDALPISQAAALQTAFDKEQIAVNKMPEGQPRRTRQAAADRLGQQFGRAAFFAGWAHYYLGLLRSDPPDRKSTRLNSSHLGISYAVFCLK